MDPRTVPKRALQHRSEQYQERLEGLRAEARELPRESGDQFLNQAFRGGTAGVRSVSVVMKEKEREVRAKSRGPAKASAVGSGSARPAPYAKPPPPLARASPPAPQSVQAKTEAVIHQVDPSFRASKARPGTVSQAAAMAVATVLANIPKAKGADILEQSCVAQTITVGSDAIF